MRAIVYARYGAPGVVALAEVPKPEPTSREVLIRVHATTVTTADGRARSLHMPAGFGLLGFEEAASLSFGATNALSFLRKAGIQRGDQVLVLGASGNVGTAAVQLAKHFGAEVTAVCSTANLELVRSIGADEVIDYTREDFAQQRDRYDIIVDTTGTTTLARCEQSLKQNGRRVAIPGRKRGSVVLRVGAIGDLATGAAVSGRRASTAGATRAP